MWGMTLSRLAVADPADATLSTPDGVMVRYCPNPIDRTWYTWRATFAELRGQTIVMCNAVQVLHSGPGGRPFRARSEPIPVYAVCMAPGSMALIEPQDRPR